MKLGYVIIYVEDVLKTLNFYEKAFGLKIGMIFEEDGVVDYGEMETTGATLGFASHQLGRDNLDGNYEKTTLKNKPFGQEIVFVVDNVVDTYATAIENGAIQFKEPKKMSWGQTIAYVRSIEGTLVEICSPMNK